MKRVIIVIVSWLVLCWPVWGDSSVWKVSKNGTELYLGGTCHILRSSDFPLPDEFDRAYAGSDLLVFETDIGEMNMPEVQQKLLSKMVYADGTGLKDHLSAEVYESLTRFCDSIGFPLSSLNSFKPEMVMLTLELMDLQMLGISEEGVDMYFYRQNQQDKKKVLQLETIDQQIDIITSMGAGDEDDYVRHSLEELSRTEKIMGQIIDHWKRGDGQDLYHLFVEPMKRDYPEIYETLLVARNEAWLPKIEEFAKTPEKEFVLVGFAHLVGEDGLIEQLKNLGYKVEKF